MPKRPRQHQIEDLSRNAFESILPHTWVYRTLSSDYGIDGHVEIFDDDGKAAALMFNVQLKATDNTNIKQSLKCTIKRSTCEYYSKLELPTLMVRYHVPSQSIFIRWFHQCSDLKFETEQKSFTFSWTIADKWTDGSPAYLRESLERFRLIKFSGLQFPMNLLFKFDPRVSEKTSEKIKIKTKYYNDYISLVDEKNESKWLLRVFVSIDKTSIELGGLSLVAFSYQSTDEFSKIDSYIKNILVLTGVGLCRIGQVRLGTEIIDSMIMESGFIEVYRNPIILEIMRWLALADKVTRILSLAKKMMQKEDNYFEGLLAELSLISKSKGLSERGFNQLVEFVRWKIDDSIAKKQYHAAATSNYSLGNMFHNRGNALGALHCYKLASKLQPKYKKKDYYIRELAGILFDLKRYHFSAKTYLEYLEVLENKEEFCCELLADAYFFSGKYENALSEFNKFFKTKRYCITDPNNYEWKLKEMLCNSIIHEYGCKEQKRKIKKAMNLSFQVHNDSKEQEIKLLEILKTDFLCGFAWFNLGVLYNASNREEDARDAFLTAALCRRNDLEAWVNAFLINLKLFTTLNMDEVGPFFPIILGSAYMIHGNDFLEKILDALPPEAPVALIMGFIKDLCVDFSSRSTGEKDKFKLRIFDPDE